MTQASWDHFSTERLGPVRGLRRWNELGSETICNLTVDPEDRDGFRGELSRVEFGAMGLVALSSNGASATGGTTGVSSWASEERDALSLVCQHEGTALVRQGRIGFAAPPSSVFLQDLARPWTFRCSGAMSMTMVKIPYSRILARIDDPGRLLEQVYTADDPATQVVRDIVASVQRALVRADAGGLDPALEDLLLDALGLLDRRVGAASALHHDQSERLVLRRRAMRHIRQHLVEPDLTVAGIARALGVSERCLQRAFVQTGETPVQFIRNQRLDLAAERLANLGGAGRESVLDTAYSAGFGDVSHFSRAFSRRFGCSPGRYRGRGRVVQ